MLAATYRVFPEETGEKFPHCYKAGWVERMEAANTLVLGLIDNKVMASDLSRPILWRKTLNQDYPCIFIGFHSFYDDIESMAVRRRVFIVGNKTNSMKEIRDIDQNMNEWSFWEENLR